MRIYTIVLLLFVLLLSNGSLLTPVAAQSTETIDIMEKIYDAIEDKDVETALTYVADDFVLTLLPAPPESNGVFAGKDAVRAWWEFLITFNPRIEFSDVIITGNRATWRAKYWGDDFIAMGLAPGEFEGVHITQNGLLKSATWVFTEEFMARWERANLLAANEALAHRYLEEMWDNGNIEVANEILADDFVDHYPLFGNTPDKAGLMADATNFHADGAKNRIEDLIVTPETIVIRDTVMMPDENGELQEALEAAIFLTVKDGQITERRVAIFGLELPPPAGE